MLDNFPELDALRARVRLLDGTLTELRRRMNAARDEVTNTHGEEEGARVFEELEQDLDSAVRAHAEDFDWLAGWFEQLAANLECGGSALLRGRIRSALEAPIAALSVAVGQHKERGQATGRTLTHVEQLRENALCALAVLFRPEGRQEPPVEQLRAIAERLRAIARDEPANPPSESRRAIGAAALAKKENLNYGRLRTRLDRQRGDAPGDWFIELSRRGPAGKYLYRPDSEEVRAVIKDLRETTINEP